MALHHDGWDLVAEADGSTGAVLATYVHGAATDELLSRRDSSGGQAVFYVHDHLGSVRALTDAQGDVVEHYRYEAFGRPSVSDASGNELPRSAYGNRFMFTGREYLAPAGLYDFRNRTYSPRWGRFIEVDPIRFQGGDLNMYRYVGNGVLNWVDLWGLYTEVIYWTSSLDYGHISVIIDGMSYSWGPPEKKSGLIEYAADSVSLLTGETTGTMWIIPEEDYIYFQTVHKHRDGNVIGLDLTPEQEEQLALELSSLGEESPLYNLTSNNCMQVVLEALQNIGLELSSDGVMPETLYNQLLEHPASVYQNYYPKQ